VFTKPDEQRVALSARTVPERAAHRDDVSLHRLRLDHGVGPHGFEQLLVRDQAPGVFDQMIKDCKGLRCQQNAFLLPCVAAPPETLIRGVEPEGEKYFHVSSDNRAACHESKVAGRSADEDTRHFDS
jgi:hypothetical protein